MTRSPVGLDPALDQDDLDERLDAADRRDERPEPDEPAALARCPRCGCPFFRPDTVEAEAREHAQAMHPGPQ